jgi:hypothetical protein
MTKTDNQNATKHGAEGAIRRISEGKPLLGIARDMQLEVEEALETQGVEAIVLEGAVGLETAARLYKNAFLAAAEKGDLEALDRFGARYGWIQSKALLAWALVKQDRKGKGGRLAEVLDAYRKQGTGSPEANE